MLYRVTIGLSDHASVSWADALDQGYAAAEPDADVQVVLRDGVLCAIASFEHEDPYAAGELARRWFVEATKEAGISQDTPLASFDVLAVAGEA